MTLRTEEAERFLALHRRPIEQAEHTAHLLVELFRGVSTLTDGLLVSLSHMIAVVGIGTSHGQSVGPGAELKIETIGDGLVGIVASAPVADDHTIEAPVVFQYLVEQNAIMTIVLVPVEVIGTHDGPCPTLCHRRLEGRQVDLVKGTIAHDNVHLMAILLVVVQRIVLHTGGHALRLETLHIGHHHTGGEQRVLTHILEVPSTERRTIDVDTRTEDDALLTIEGLLTEALAIEARHLGVPCGRQTGQCGEGHTRVVGLSGLHPLVPEHIGTNTMRTVVGPEVREAQTLHTRTGELRLRMDHSDLLIERHPGQGILDALFHRLRLVEIDRCLRVG